MEPLIALIRRLPEQLDLTTAALLLARLMPLVVITPLFGGAAVTMRFRTVLAIVLSLALTPMAPDEAPPGGPSLFLALAGAAVTGLVTALLIQLVFSLVTATGGLVDLSRGATLANIYDPANQQQASVLQVFHAQALLAVFFTVDAHHRMLEAFAESLRRLPPDDPLAAIEGPGSVLVFRLLGELFLVAIRLAAPVIAVIFITDVALGLLNRLAPQVQVYFLGLSVKAPLGLLVLLLVLGTVLDDAAALLVTFTLRILGS